MTDAINDELIERVLPVDEKALAAEKGKQSQMSRDIVTLLDVKYAELTRFKADRCVEEFDTYMHSIDAFVNEHDTEVNRRLREAQQIIEHSKDVDYPRQGNPYYELAEAFGLALHHVLVTNHWRSSAIEAQNALISKLFRLNQDMKDTEIETQKIAQEKLLTDAIRKDYQDMLKEQRVSLAEKDRTIISLTDNVRQLAREVREMRQAEPERELPIFDSAAGDEDEVPQLSPAEEAALRRYTQLTSRIKFVVEKHPDWKDEWVAQHAGATVEQVKAARASAKEK